MAVHPTISCAYGTNFELNFWLNERLIEGLNKTDDLFTLLINAPDTRWTHRHTRRSVMTTVTISDLHWTNREEGICTFKARLPRRLMLSPRRQWLKPYIHFRQLSCTIIINNDGGRLTLPNAMDR